MKNPVLISLLCSLLFGACSNEVENPLSDEVKYVEISAEDFVDESGSRTNLTIGSGGAVFSWAEKDTVGIFPNEGAQVYFPMKEGAGTKTATFSGGGWALKNGSTYSAYYPFIGDYYIDKENLPLDYTGQEQIGNASTAHLGAYDFMAAPPTSPSWGSVNFKFTHLGSLMQIRLTIPAIGAFTTLALKSVEPIFTTTAKLGFANRNYTFTSTKIDNKLTLKLSEIETSAEGQQCTFYLMAAPTNMLGNSVRVCLYDSNGKVYSAILESKNMQAGYSYDFEATLEEYTENLSTENVSIPSLGEENVIE